MAGSLYLGICRLFDSSELRKELFVVTHPQSIHHTAKKVGGWYDTGLTSKGREDAEAIAEHMEG
nr:histidine phosphatase family protein [arsenite-oxidising bacterium NT-25]